MKPHIESLAPGDGDHPPAAVRAGAPAIPQSYLFLLVASIFIAPNALFATALRPAPMAALLLGCAGAGAVLWRAARESAFLRAPIDAVQLLLCLALGFAACLLGGEGHFFPPRFDWLIRDAVLADLVRNGVAARYHYEAQEYLLRAPLGMYLIPAMAGRLAGLHVAHLTLLAQNSIIVGVVAYFTASIGKVRRAPLVLLVLCFSGLDILGVGAAAAIEAMHGGAPLLPDHLEWWSLEFAPFHLQYSSAVTQLFWVPNHMAPGWWLALLTLFCLRGAIGFPALLVSCAPLLVWSPLSTLGAAPFVLLLALRRPLSRLLTPALAAAVLAGLCFLPVALYLTIDAGAVPHGWLVSRDGFARQYVFFILLEIPQAAVVLYGWGRVEKQDRAAFLVALATLLVLPVYSFGPFNDLLMRGSIPALFVLAFNFARVAVLTPRDGGGAATVVSSLVLISAATPMLEVRAALVDTSWAVSDCNLLTSWRELPDLPFPSNYLAREEKAPGWLIAADAAPLALEQRACWPDHPFINARRK